MYHVSRIMYHVSYIIYHVSYHGLALRFPGNRSGLSYVSDMYSPISMVFTGFFLCGCVGSTVIKTEMMPYGLP